METFTRLYPDRAEGLTALDLAAELPGPVPDDRPFVCLNMIATADGRATIRGRAGHIANQRRLRALPRDPRAMDAIMVGAETIRVESYGRTINSAEARERREREGMPADAVTVVVSRRVSLPAGVGLLRRRRTRSSSLTPSENGELPPGRGDRALPARARHRPSVCAACAPSTASGRSSARAGRPQRDAAAGRA